jgi:glycine cleavage system H lipoate-binding protein
MVALFVILMIITFLVVDVIVQKVQMKKSLQSVPELQGVTPQINVARRNDFALPKGIFFHKGHTWANILFTGKVKVGVDDFVQKVMGNIDGIELPALGSQVKQGETLLTLKQGNRTMTLASPIEGTVTALNEESLTNPNLLKTDCYKEGWLVLVTPTNLLKSLSSLTIAEGAIGWLNAEVKRFRDFLAGSRIAGLQGQLVGQALQDGGLPADGVLAQLDDQTWQQFQQEFLK